MLILAIFWLSYTVYRLIRLLIYLLKGTKPQLYKIIDSFCDLCLGITLLLFGLVLNGTISSTGILLSIPMVLYLIGKFTVKKLK